MTDQISPTDAALARCRADAAATIAKMRLEIDRLRAGLVDLAEDDMRHADEMREVAAAILNPKFRRHQTR